MSNVFDDIVRKPADRREQYKAYNAKRRDDPEYRAKQAAWQKAWSDANPPTPEKLARKAEQMRKYYHDPLLHPKHKARIAVSGAIKAGKLIRQPCQVCGAIEAQAHHDDYSKPLQVIWLCRPHHIAHHIALNQKASK